MVNSLLFMSLHDLVRPLYNQSHRVFHSNKHLEHGAYILNILLKDNYDISDVQIAAWYFHDSVYEIGAEDNEEKSALLFKSYNEKYNLGFSSDEIITVTQIILDTKKHVSTCEASKLILDIDLFIFGSTFEVFKEYRKEIEMEYRSFYTDEEIKEGTILFFNEIINSGRAIYNTTYFEKHESNAKNNILQFLKEYNWF